MCYITEKEKRKDHVGFGDILRADLPFIKKTLGRWVWVWGHYSVYGEFEA